MTGLPNQRGIIQKKGKKKFAVQKNKQGVNHPHFKLLIVGDGGTGKTALVKRHLTGDFQRNYEPTSVKESHKLDFYTNRGKISFTCLDIPARDRYGQHRYIHSDCAIIMFDVTNRLTYDNVPTWYRDLRRLCGSIPIVLCGNKIEEIKKSHVQPKPIPFYHNNGCGTYFEISVKSNYNLENPFLYLASELMRDEDLYFVESPSLLPPEIQIDMTAHQQSETQIVEAANRPLPDDDDDDGDVDFFVQNIFPWDNYTTSHPSHYTSNRRRSSYNRPPTTLTQK